LADAAQKDNFRGWFFRIAELGYNEVAQGSHREDRAFRARTPGMKVLITGICGFVGSSVAHSLLDHDSSLSIMGLDNFIRPGSETNRAPLLARGLKFFHGDIRCQSDFEMIPPADWLIDAAANPSVLAGLDGKTSSRQLVEHNLAGTINLLEYCKRFRAGFILVSTSRVYSIPPLRALPVEVVGRAYRPRFDEISLAGLSAEGISEDFSTAPPASLYGTTKFASENLALEYADSFDFPVWINRCGVLAGAGQFGRADQGIFAFWINSYLQKRPLQYIGFDGMGHQVRDCFHPHDLAEMLWKQMSGSKSNVDRVQNLSGGIESAISLAQLSDWCAERFERHEIAQDLTPRPFDLPWMVLDSARARKQWSWAPSMKIAEILEEIAGHAEQHPDWLEISGSP
jgi:CDP-paratose 2-epimerase